MIESRHHFGTHVKPVDLPSDYLNELVDVFSIHYGDALSKLESMKSGPYFSANGGIYLDEVVVSLSIQFDKSNSAITVFASSDFDPNASSPSAEQVLAACVDAIGFLFSKLLNADEENLNAIASGRLTELNDIPLIWTEVEMEKFKIFLKVDRSNPNLDDQATQWLEENDPEETSRIEHEQEDQESFSKARLTIRTKKDH